MPKTMFTYGKSNVSSKFKNADWMYGKPNSFEDKRKEPIIVIEPDEILVIEDQITTQQQAQDFVDQFEHLGDVDYELFKQFFHTGKIESDRIKADLDTVIANLKTTWGL